MMSADRGTGAAYHGVSLSISIIRFDAHHPAVDYGNWHVLRSVATDPRLKFFRGKGSSRDHPWSDSGWLDITGARSAYPSGHIETVCMGEEPPTFACDA